MIEQDLAAMFTDLAVQAVLTPYGGGTAIAAPVFFDAAGAVLGDVITFDPTVVVQRTSWPAVKVNDQVVTGGVTYKVRTVLPENDGATLTVALVRV